MLNTFHENVLNVFCYFCQQNYGSIAHLKLVRHKETGKSRGICFITFDKKSSAARAIEECSPGKGGTDYDLKRGYKV